MASAAPARSTAGPSAQESSRVTMSYLKEHKLVAVPASSTAVMDALQINVESEIIHEDHEPGDPLRPQAVFSRLHIKRSIVLVERLSQGKLCIHIDSFNFTSYGMVNTSAERGYFVHKAKITLHPLWSSPGGAVEVRPLTAAKTLLKTKGKGRHLGLTVATIPGATAQGSNTTELQFSRPSWVLQAIPTPHTAAGAVAWAWWTNSWGGERQQSFDSDHSQRYMVGGVPPLPYGVEDGVAGFTYRGNGNEEHITAHWDVAESMISGAAGKLKMRVELELELQRVKSCCVFVKAANEWWPVSSRPCPGFKSVIMSATFTV